MTLETPKAMWSFYPTLDDAVQPSLHEWWKASPIRLPSLNPTSSRMWTWGSSQCDRASGVRWTTIIVGSETLSIRLINEKRPKFGRSVVCRPPCTMGSVLCDAFALKAKANANRWVRLWIALRTRSYFRAREPLTAWIWLKIGLNPDCFIPLFCSDRFNMSKTSSLRPPRFWHLQHVTPRNSFAGSMHHL